MHVPTELVAVARHFASGSASDNKALSLQLLEHGVGAAAGGFEELFVLGRHCIPGHLLLILQLINESNYSVGTGKLLLVNVLSPLCSKSSFSAENTAHWLHGWADTVKLLVQVLQANESW